MQYLIDGHNVIAQLPDISLDDPDDEAKLVIRLRSWAAGKRQRRVTVYFDSGLPGGEARHLSTSQVKVVFASVGRTADQLLVARINKLRNPEAYTLISSDREIVAVAPRGLRLMSAEAFASELVSLDKRAGETSRQASEKPSMSPEDVAEWMALFGPPATGEEQTEKPTKPPSPRKHKKTREEQGSSRNPATIKSGNRKLTTDEVGEWLEIFGDLDEQ
jgi:predicted RNA-binding protein with PIN domain